MIKIFKYFFLIVYLINEFDKYTEKVIGIHLDIPRPEASIILKAIKEAGIDYPRYYKYVPHLTLYNCRFPFWKFPQVGNIRNTNAMAINLQIDKVSIRKKNNKEIFFHW